MAAIKPILFVEYSKKVLGLYHTVLYRQEDIKRVSPFDSLVGGTRHISFNSAVSARLFSTSVQTKPSSFVSPDFLTGFSWLR